MEKFTRKGHEGVTFFIGPEIEQTPAFNKKTLFVVGLQDTATIEKLAVEHGVRHIFLSANRSFDSLDKVNGVYMVDHTKASDWAYQLQHLLESGYMVSIDYPAHKHAMALEVFNKNIWQNRNFVPVLSVAIPHVNTSSVNLTVKIDDVNFGATNPGVWCMNHTEVTDSNRFTNWNEYGDDVVIETAREERKVHYIDVGDMSVKNAQEAVTAFKEAFNDAELGLDPTAKSSLKPENEKETLPKVENVVPTTPQVAAEAYAEGAKEDPLSAKDPKKLKPKVTK